MPTLRSIICRWRFASSSAKRPISPKPALLTSISTCSPLASRSASSFAAAFAFDRSIATARALPSSFASSSSRSLRRAASTSAMAALRQLARELDPEARRMRR